MKKYIIFILVALLLVCAVSCSATKNMGKLEVEIDNTDIEDETWQEVVGARLFVKTTAETKSNQGIVLDLDDVKAGKVEVYLPESTYEGYIVLINKYFEDNFGRGYLEFDETYFFTIEEGKTTKCTCTLECSPA